MAKVKTGVRLSADVVDAASQYAAGDETRPATTVKDALEFLIKKGLQAVGASTKPPAADTVKRADTTR